MTPIGLYFSGDFITDYTDGVLRRHSRSSENQSITVLSEDQVAVQEVTAANFQDIVMDEQKVS